MSKTQQYMFGSRKKVKIFHLWDGGDTVCKTWFIENMEDLTPFRSKMLDFGVSFA